MSKNKETPPSIRSSAAEYLTFVAARGEGGVEAISADSELQEDAVIRHFRITATDGTVLGKKYFEEQLQRSPMTRADPRFAKPRL